MTSMETESWKFQSNIKISGMVYRTYTLVLFGVIVKCVDLHNRIPFYIEHPWLVATWIIYSFIVDSGCSSGHVKLLFQDSL